MIKTDLYQNKFPVQIGIKRGLEKEKHGFLNENNMKIPARKTSKQEIHKFHCLIFLLILNWINKTTKFHMTKQNMIQL